jgi:hypothetical protein
MRDQFRLNSDVSGRDVIDDPYEENFVRVQSIERLTRRLFCFVPRIRFVKALELTEFWFSLLAISRIAGARFENEIDIRERDSGTGT